MFDPEKFLFDTFMDGVNRGVPRWNIGLASFPYYKSGAISADKMEIVNNALDERDAPKPEPEIDPDMMIDTPEQVGEDTFVSEPVEEVK